MMRQMSRIRNMLNYAICEIAGKQYKLIPGKKTDIYSEFEPGQTIESKILLLSEKGKLKLGNPYLKEKVVLECIKRRSIKVHVRKYHAKANYRRTTGSKSYISTVILPVKKVS